MIHKKMKIGIITHPFHFNYGGILQNYALQQILKKMGHNPVTYRLSIIPGVNKWLYVNLKICIKKILGHKIKFIESPDKIKKRLSGFEKFISKNIVCTKPEKGDIPAKFISDYKLDAIIVGSDQVWRPKYVRNIYNMYLDFAIKSDIKKISYAASFGTDKWEYNAEQEIKCKELIKSFYRVSVREEGALSLCKEKLGIEASLVLDPTLLLERIEYEKLCLAPSITTPYLLVFLLDKNERKLSIANTIAHELNLRPIIVNTGNDIQENDLIENWLTLYKNSSNVITDSFHGTVFSIIFNKPFLTFHNEKRGNSRIDNILKLANITNCLISEESKNIGFPEIDWDKVNDRISDYRVKSIEFLSDALKN